MFNMALYHSIIKGKGFSYDSFFRRDSLVHTPLLQNTCDVIVLVVASERALFFLFLVCFSSGSLFLLQVIYYAVIVFVCGHAWSHSMNEVVLFFRVALHTSDRESIPTT